MTKTSPSNHHRLFPWSKLRKGQGFFVPCLNLDEIQRIGLDEALRHHIFGAKATPAIRGGLIGVWFYRPTPRN